MTGAEFRAMRLTKAALAALMLAVTAGNTQAALTATATLTINATFTQPSCDITAPPSFDLGILTPGVKTHGPLTITWTCADGGTPLKTALTAAIVRGGKVSGDEKVTLLTDDSSASPTGATLSLREQRGDTLIKLTGPSGGDYFCSDANAVAGVMRTCTLTPETTVSQNGPFGLASATLNFAVVYP
ncbi:TPA: F18 fimbrial protein FedE [Escherichia coli]|nr:F18 fimbrial protein FedE [Escherichia coli]HBA8029072.1 F18 fimbrial protein FedE [Escherichia coli]HBA8043632.1 F18 fimbrial protein FedE [Escherichia coli]HBA8936676.1 F18 fimbrial protein FedE [Escherichia coli]HBA8978528.1 F18 fimbrial protein FedE [Escherichia coli]